MSATDTKETETWKRVREIVDEYIDGYEMIGETESGQDAYYAPNEFEKSLITDAINGLIDEPEFRSAFKEVYSVMMESVALDAVKQRDRANDDLTAVTAQRDRALGLLERAIDLMQHGSVCLADSGPLCTCDHNKLLAEYEVLRKGER